jgi:hypothetical protein
MWASIMPLGERREEARRPSHVHARLRTTDVRPVNQFEALIQERGRRGVRLTSSAPLLADTVVVVHPSGEQRPLHARVVWARRLESRPDPTWLAGCRLLGLAAEPTTRAGDPALIREPDAVATRVLVAAGLIGLVVLIVYTILTFARDVGEAALGP